MNATAFVGAAAAPQRLFLGDWLVVAGYFAVILGLAWWSLLRSRKTAEDFFLASRHLGWFVIGASVFASNIGSEHLVGLAGAGCTSGVAMAHYELHAWCLLVLAWVLVPFYARSKVFTMPEFLERRYSSSARWVLSILSLVAYIFTKIAVAIFAGGVVFKTLLPEFELRIGGTAIDSFWVSSALVLAVTGLYAALGGLRAVAYTETIQTFVFIIGSALVTFFGLKALGGWSELRNVLASDAHTADYFSLWRPLGDPSGQVPWYFNQNFPWLGMLVCAPIIGLWYWCTDQYIVQRVLGAPDERQARRGSVWAACLKLLPVFIFIVPGMICFALAKSGKVGFEQSLVLPNGKPNEEACQAAFPLMVVHVLPPVVRGIVVAGLLSALMSSLAACFNACATLFTMDIYQKFRPGVSQARLVWMGRLVTTVMVAIGLAWIPVIRGSQGLYVYLQSVQGYLAPPIFVVFFFGVFSKRLNAKGCLAALVGGFLLGLFRLAVDTPTKLYKDFQYAEGSFLWFVNNLYFQYYSAIVFLFSVALILGVSYLTKPPPEARLRGLTYATVTPEDRAKSRASWGWIEVLMSAFVLGAILAAYLYFTG
ncbi:MAG: sodium:solute symporter [Planctomycetota bacterium]